MIRTILAGGLALAAAACSAPAPEAQNVTGSFQVAAASACAARNGEMKQVGRMQSWQCVITYADAGKPCADSAQCEGECMLEGNAGVPAGAAATGACQATSNRFGCRARVEDGKAGLTVCID